MGWVGPLFVVFNLVVATSGGNIAKNPKEMDFKNCITGEWSKWIHYESYTVANLADLQKQGVVDESTKAYVQEQCAAFCNRRTDLFGAVFTEDSMCHLLKAPSGGATLRLQQQEGATVTLRKGSVGDSPTNVGGIQLAVLKK